MANVKVQKNKGTPLVEVFIGGSGGPYDGRVTVTLFTDATGTKSVPLIPTQEYATGNMRVPLCPNAIAPDIASLDGMIITWVIDVVSFTNQPNEKYFVTVKVEQDGDPVVGNPPAQTGALTGGAQMVDGEMGVTVS
jgi:hypothetical protein